MKNANGVIVNRVIDDLKRIPRTVKANDTVFIRKLPNQSIKRGTFALRTRLSIHDSVVKCMNNVLFADIMPERGLMKLNGNIHRIRIA
jgi:hypothetical protein